MFRHFHPYPCFIPPDSTRLIVGTLPPPRFATKKLKPGDVDFNYGSRDGQLWPILGRIFNLSFTYQTTQKAIDERKAFLVKHRIGICDIVACGYREKIDASDLGIKKFELRDLIEVLGQHPSIHRLLFTGGNSKNGPEYFFRKLLKTYPEIRLQQISKGPPRIHEFTLDKRRIQTVSLTAPSGAANRAVGGMTLYKTIKQAHPEFTTLDFRVLQYTPFFKE